MGCFREAVDKDMKQLRFLLGPLKWNDKNEMKIYAQAALFKHTIATKAETTLTTDGNNEKDQHACGSQEKDADNHVTETKSLGKSLEDSECLFIPLECTTKSLKVQQTFNMWKAPLDIGWKFRRMKKRKTIALQPLDTFPEFVERFRYKGQDISFFTFLKDFTRIYFYGFNVEVLEPVDMAKAEWNITSRIHPKTNEKQYLVKDIQKCLQKNIPRNSYCSVGISWTDLYPSDDLNFVLGEAHSALNAGVLSFGRFEPKAYKDGQAPPTVEHFDGKLLWRMLKVLSHETCHIFGLAHCVYFECNMNESTSLPEAMSQPLYLCPVCLRKLQKVCKFNLKARYVLLLQFLQEVSTEYPGCENFTVTIRWLRKCLDLLNDTESTYL